MPNSCKNERSAINLSIECRALSFYYPPSRTSIGNRLHMAPEFRFRSHNMIATVIYCPILIVFVGFDDSLIVFTSFTINIPR